MFGITHKSCSFLVFFYLFVIFYISNQINFCIVTPMGIMFMLSIIMVCMVWVLLGIKKITRPKFYVVLHHNMCCTFHIPQPLLRHCYLCSRNLCLNLLYILYFTLLCVMLFRLEWWRWFMTRFPSGGHDSCSAYGRVHCAVHHGEQCEACLQTEVVFAGSSRALL